MMPSVFWVSVENYKTLPTKWLFQLQFHHAIENYLPWYLLCNIHQHQLQRSKRLLNCTLYGICPCDIITKLKGKSYDKLAKLK